MVPKSAKSNGYRCLTAFKTAALCTMKTCILHKRTLPLSEACLLPAVTDRIPETECCKICVSDLQKHHMRLLTQCSAAREKPQYAIHQQGLQTSANVGDHKAAKGFWDVLFIKRPQLGIPYCGESVKGIQITIHLHSKPHGFCGMLI